MTTFTITEAPSGPNEITPGTINLANYTAGDTFIVASDVTSDIKFTDSTNSGAEFNIVFNDSLSDSVKVEIKDGLQADVMVADNVDLGDDFEFNAKEAGDLTFTAGDTVNLGNGVQGPKHASTTFSAGDNLTVGALSFGNQDDTIEIGDGVTLLGSKYELGSGDDSLTIGDTTSTYKVSGGDGNDTINLGTSGGVDVDGGKGDDQIIAYIDPDTDADYDFDGGKGDDSLSLVGLTNEQAEDVINSILDEAKDATYDDNDTGDHFLDDVITADEISGSNIELGDGGASKLSKFETFNFVCFAGDTLIKTSMGNRKIKDLSVGDYVLTADKGYQPIRWIGGRHISAATLLAHPKLRPIRIRAGALGARLPETDLIVSRQHRVLVRSQIANRMFGCNEVLVAVAQLLAIDGIEIADDLVDVSYWHMLFENHEVIWSNGAQTESLFTGPEALKSVSPDAESEILSLFPELAAPDFQPMAARVIPSQGRQAKRLAERHQKNQKPLVVQD